eukprot:1751132-Rhodomonas_salina.1
MAATPPARARRWRPSGMAQRRRSTAHAPSATSSSPPCAAIAATSASTPPCRIASACRRHALSLSTHARTEREQTGLAEARTWLCLDLERARRARRAVAWRRGARGCWRRPLTTAATPPCRPIASASSPLPASLSTAPHASSTSPASSAPRPTLVTFSSARHLAKAILMSQAGGKDTGVHEEGLDEGGGGAGLEGAVLGREVEEQRRQRTCAPHLHLPALPVPRHRAHRGLHGGGGAEAVGVVGAVGGEGAEGAAPLRLHPARPDSALTLPQSKRRRGGGRRPGRAGGQGARAWLRPRAPRPQQPRPRAGPRGSGT